MSFYTQTNSHMRSTMSSFEPEKHVPVPYYHEYCTIPNNLPAPYYYEDIASPHSQFNPAELCNYSKMTSYETMSSFEPGKYLPVPYYHEYCTIPNIQNC